MPFTLNKFDCAGAIKGTGTRGCTTDMNVPVSVWLVEQGTEFDPAVDTFDQAFIDTLICEGKLIVLPAHSSFVNNTAESVYEEFANTGQSAFVRYSPVSLMLTYIKGVCFNNALSTLSTKSWDMFILDFDNGFVSRIWGEESSTGIFKGFETSQVTFDSRTIADGAVSTKSNLKIELTQKGTAGFLAKQGFLVSDDNLDFSSVDGVNDLSLELVTPAAAGVQIRVFEGCGQSTIVSGLTNAAQWRAIDNTGASIAVDTVAFANGLYTLTGAGITAGNSYQFEVYDFAGAKDIVVVQGVYYDSDPTTLTALS